MSVLMNFAIFPTSKGESVSPFVARVIRLVDTLGYNYQLTAMGTIVETPTIEQSLEVIKKAYAELEPDCERVYASVNLDIRKGSTGRLQSKVASVEQKLK